MAFANRGIPLSEDELHIMIAEFTSRTNPANSATSSAGGGATASIDEDDSKITFEEFKQVALKGSKLNTTKLWESVRNTSVKVPVEALNVAAVAAQLKNNAPLVPAAIVIAPEPFLSVSVVKLPQRQPFNNEFAVLPIHRPVVVPVNVTLSSPLESLRSKIHDDRVLAYKSAAAGTALLAVCAAYRRFVKHL